MNLPTAALRTALLGLALGASGAMAANTNIAQVPLLNITGTGTVKPNLMVIYDNSGSMRQTYTPDYIDDGICRSAATMSVGRRACAPGDAPFMAGEFNRQYYNPKLTYLPPVRADGTQYNSMTAANTSNWTVVVGDGFGINNYGMDTSLPGTINLTNGFPDWDWCNGSDCRTNTTTYTYPDNTYRTPVRTTTNPYYYSILAAEYCTDRTLTTCVSVTPGAAAPDGYPFPAKVRWCNSVYLTVCQAKYLAGSYVYPRFSSPTASAAAAYGVISLGLTTSNKRTTIRSVTIAESGGPVIISNGPVVASTGVDTAAKQNALANALAASIKAKTGLTRQYTACVKTPNNGAIENCGNWGINLTGNNLVAVIPITCAPTATGKGLGDCSVVSDNSRNGWGVTVLTDAPATALIRVTGTTSNNKVARLAAGTALGGTTVLGASIDFASSTGAAAMASTIASRIGTGAGNPVIAYAAPNSVTNICAAQPSGTVCLIDNSGATGLAVSMAALSNNAGAGGSASGGSIVFNTTASSRTGEDVLPVTTTALSAGGAIFVRTDIKPTQTTYPRDTGRTDCVTNSTTCTYAEEMTNFANWYVYYKTRNQMMKVALGRAFQPINANFRVGMVSLSRAAGGLSFEQLPADFTGTARTIWYNHLYLMNGNSITPMRGALHAVGQMYANTSLNVVQYPCQQNFTFVTTDGYWNGDAAPTVVDNDNTHNPARFCTTIKGCPDPRNTSPQSLADIALYWYNGGSNGAPVSLNPAIDDMSKPGQVPGAADDNTHLHMKTYTLGLGMIGVMDFDPNYDTAPEVGGDFYRLLTGATGCPWNGGGRYVWPDPKAANGAATVQERVDDLWHAAINGRGKYFSAQDPQEVVTGLNAALNNIQARTGAAAAAATSTPNISQDDNDIFTDTFTTVKWYGELTKKKIDINTGEVLPGVVWSTSDRLGTQVGNSTDGRTIKMFGSGADNLKNFLYSDMNAQEKAWFDAKCMSLPQCSSLSLADRELVNSGNNMVNWLRGQQQHADNRIFRSYAQSATATPLPIVLGDIASAKPAYVRDPRKSYTLPGYPAFKEAKKNRLAVVYVAANDGMLHAFRAGGTNQGEELWAYAPRITMKKLFMQSSTTYGTNHQFTVDGSPEVADVKIGSEWKTVLVAGLNGGGRGYYALDVTDPLQPKALWEICADSAVCAINDPDIGLTFGNPQIGFWDNKWVVFFTSGYNNVPGVDGVNSGTGGGFLYAYDIATGAQLAKIATGSGDTSTPSGLAKITAVSSNPDSDPLIKAIYGGDNQGQLWRFDMPSGATVNKTLMTTTDGGRPITTRPEITGCRVNVRGDEASESITHQMVLFGTGRLLDLPDITDTSLQTVYAIKDSNRTVTAKGGTMARQSLARTGTGDTYKLTESGGDDNLDGWYMDLSLNAGERVNLDPKVIRGTAVVITNVPAASSSCSVGGTSNLYQLNMCTGRSVFGVDGQVGRVLSNTSAAVGSIIVRTATGALKLVTTLADGSLDTDSLDPSVTEDPRIGGWRRIHNN